MTGCLSRIRVLDLSRVFSGPWAAQMLADFGADVIKVERPGRGDDVRQQGYAVKDREGRETSETSSFLAMNRGKRSITIDMASDGRAGPDPPPAPRAPTSCWRTSRPAT